VVDETGKFVHKDGLLPEIRLLSSSALQKFKQAEEKHNDELQAEKVKTVNANSEANEAKKKLRYIQKELKKVSKFTAITDESDKMLKKYEEQLKELVVDETGKFTVKLLKHKDGLLPEIESVSKKVIGLVSRITDGLKKERFSVTNGNLEIKGDGNQPAAVQRVHMIFRKMFKTAKDFWKAEHKKALQKEQQRTTAAKEQLQTHEQNKKSEINEALKSLTLKLKSTKKKSNAQWVLQFEQGKEQGKKEAEAKLQEGVDTRLKQIDLKSKHLNAMEKDLAEQLQRLNDSNTPQKCQCKGYDAV